MTNNKKITKIGKMWQNSKCSLSGDRNETINHIISEIRAKTRYDWAGKVIYKKLCKKFKFDHTNKWYVHKEEFVLENETHKIL